MFGQTGGVAYAGATSAALLFGVSGKVPVSCGSLHAFLLPPLQALKRILMGSAIFCGAGRAKTVAQDCRRTMAKI